MDSFVIKLSGKAELPEALQIGHNFEVNLIGSIISETKSDNDDGTHTTTYLFKPVIVQTVDAKGVRLRAKDTRSRSQQLRSLLYKRWREENEPVEFDTYYDNKMLEIMGQS